MLKEEKEQGILSTKLDIAKALLSMGLHIEQIIKVTGLTQEDIKELE